MRCGRTFRSSRRRVNGKPLIWFDNAATTQKPQVVIDRLSLFLRPRELQHPPRGARAGGPGDRRLRRGPGHGSAIHRCIEGRRDHLRARHHRSDQPGRARPGAASICYPATRSSSLISSTTPISFRGSCLRSKPAPSCKVAPVDDAGNLLLSRVRGPAGPEDEAGCRSTQVSNALGTVTPVREDRRAGATATGRGC